MKDAARHVADRLNLARRDVYQAALALADQTVSGARSYHAGRVAEDSVAELYRVPVIRSWSSVGAGRAAK